MNTTEVIAKAERGELAHDAVYAELVKFAEMQRQRGQSRDQAFSYFITKTAEGRELFATYRKMSGGEFDLTKAEPMKPQRKQVPVQKDDDIAWGDLVKAYAKSYGLSEAKAIDQIMLTEEGRQMFRATMKRERARNPDFSENDYAFLAACDAQRDADHELHKANKRSEFEDRVAEVRARFPNMSLSDVMTHVQSLYPDAWRKAKEVGPAWEQTFADLGVGAPGDGEISGKPSPSRAPLWEGEQTSSHLTPPPVPEQMSPPTPRYKSAAAQTAEANFAFFTKILFDASARAGRPWSVEKCIATLRACPAANQYFVTACGA
jgi:hypothetical protein